MIFRHYWAEVANADQVVLHDLGNMTFSMELEKEGVKVIIPVDGSCLTSTVVISNLIEEAIIKNSPWVCKECERKDEEIKDNERIHREGFDILVRICSALEKEFGSECPLSDQRADQSDT